LVFASGVVGVRSGGGGGRVGAAGGAPSTGTSTRTLSTMGHPYGCPEGARRLGGPVVRLSLLMAPRGMEGACLVPVGVCGRRGFPCSPLSPLPPHSRFNLTTTGWVDAEQSGHTLPLQYRFAALGPGGSAMWMPLSDYSPETQVSLQLPMAVVDSRGRVTLVALAKNAAGCEVQVGSAEAVFVHAPTMGALSEQFGDGGPGAGNGEWVVPMHGRRGQCVVVGVVSGYGEREW
jgi:hypothetical protein